MSPREANPAGVQQPRRVLCVGYTRPPLEELALVLSRAGYDTICATSIDDAKACMAAHAFDALVLGHAVPESDREELVAHAKRGNPNIVVVLLYWDSIRRAECADAVLFVGSGPTVLAETLRGLLRSR